MLAHETGHVLSEHYTYTTALVLLQQFMEGRAAPIACCWACRSGPST